MLIKFTHVHLQFAVPLVCYHVSYIPRACIYFTASCTLWQWVSVLFKQRLRLLSINVGIASISTVLLCHRRVMLHPSPTWQCKAAPFRAIRCWQEVMMLQGSNYCTLLVLHCLFVCGWATSLPAAGIVWRTTYNKGTVSPSRCDSRADINQLYFTLDLVSNIFHKR